MGNFVTYTADTHRGKYRPQNPQKYRGNVNNICYRSSYEVKFMRWCDINRNVLEWGSEEIVVPYINPFDHKQHRYFVDFWIKVQRSDGTIRKYLVEVKPLKYTQEPKKPQKKTKRFVQEVVQWGVNQAKWASARKYAKTIGCEFTLVTEQDLGIDAIPLAPFRMPHK